VCVGEVTVSVVVRVESEYESIQNTHTQSGEISVTHGFRGEQMFVWRVEAFEEEGVDIGGVYVSGMFSCHVN
jgi:hypothetical protein